MADIAADLNRRFPDLNERFRRLLQAAGITAGMRVLDVGCGNGDGTFLLAELVGEQGQVVGIDRDDVPLAIARERAQAQGAANVTFVKQDLGTLSSEQGLFDAAVGRRVLMYQPNAVAAVKQLVSVVRPGGVVVFQEHDATIGPRSQDALPLHKQVRQWAWEMVKREGANVHLGFDLPAVCTQAGLEVEYMQAEAVVITPTQHHPIAGIIRAVMPRIIQQGVATVAEIDIDTLESRLLAEKQQAGATFVWEMVFGIWARNPGYC